MLVRRRLLSGMGLGALATGLQAASRPAAQRQLRVASFPDLDRAARLAIPAFERRHPGVRVRLSVLSYADFPTAMITALAAGANLPDLMAMDREIVGKLADSAGLQDLRQPRFGAAALSGEMAAFALAAGHARSGALTAFPVDIGPGALFYRADLLRDAGLEELELTRSWPDALRAGVQLKRRHGAYLLGSAVDLKDIVLRTRMNEGEGVYFDRGGRPLVRSPRFETAFALAKQARQAGIDARVTAWSNEWAEGLRRGRIAAQPFGSWFAGHLQNWIAPKAAGLWRSAPLPDGAFASWGGSYYAIPRDAREPELAWDFLRLLALDPGQQMAAFEDLDAFPVLLAAQQHPYFDAPMPYFGGQRARQQWRDAAQRVPAVDADRHDAMAQDVVNAALERVLEHGESIPAALRDAEQRILRRGRLLRRPA